MTLLSCLLIGLAFLLAVFLLVTAGVLLGWVLPFLIERSREKRRDPTRHGR
jgi:Mg/Co/Ni transporter MgtE